MAQCKACLYKTEHPFGLTLNDGLCSGCITHQEKYYFDWGKKYQELQNIAVWCKGKSRTYDCVVPVIGDAEDYYVVSKVVELGLNPLIVSVNSYFLNDIGWSNLQNLITYFDLDSWIYNPEIYTYKELIRTSLRKYNHMYLPWLQLHTSFPVHVAKEKNIPLIIWGGNQSVEQVGKFSHNDQVEMSSWSRTEHDLFGKNIITLMGNGAQVNERKINYYRYPEISKLGKNIKGIYLSNFMLWDPLKQNRSTINFGFKPETNIYSFDPYERAGSSVYYGIHDLLKSKRVKYRKVTDQITREIRHGRVSINEAKRLLNYYESLPVNVSGFFNWLGVTESGQQWYIDRFVDKNLIVKGPQSEFQESNLNLPAKIFNLVNVEKYEPNESFVLFGKEVFI